jgi:hypothetical protein
MAQVKKSTRAKMNDFLAKKGLGGLDDPNLFHQMAFLIRDHEHFRGILMLVPPQDRYTAYTALAPKLTFKAKPLDDYEAEAKYEAERKQLPVIDSRTGELREFKAPDINELATKAIKDAEKAETAKGNLRLTCSKCTAYGTFPAKNRVQAYFDAKVLGWMVEGETAICPKCPAIRLT